MTQAPQRFNQERLEAWLSRPDTRIFRQFLRDRQMALGLQWAQGRPLDLSDQAAARHWGELADLAWADYADFYDIEQPPADAD